MTMTVQYLFRPAAFDEPSCSWQVPKNEPVGVLTMLTQKGRPTVAKELPLANVLTMELLNFRVKIACAGNETFESWRERDHDGMVLTLAITLWFAQWDPGWTFAESDSDESLNARLPKDVFRTEPPQ